jgi:hypothetical protein
MFGLFRTISQLCNIEFINSLYSFKFQLLILLLFLQTCVSRNRQYLPAWRSGPYAILMTLLKESQKPDYPGNSEYFFGLVW